MEVPVKRDNCNDTVAAYGEECDVNCDRFLPDPYENTSLLNVLHMFARGEGVMCVLDDIKIHETRKYHDSASSFVRNVSSSITNTT